MKNFFKDSLLIFFVLVVMFFISDLPSFSRTLKFVQLSDIHYSLVKEDYNYKLLSKSRPLLKDAISQINNKKNIDFVMISGDGIDKPNKDSLLALTAELNTLNYPWYYVLGNHDTTCDGFLKKDKFVEILKDTNPNYKFDSTYYTFKPKKGYRVIVLDGAKNKGISSHGVIPDEELNWLDEVLSKSKDDVVLIFIHFPVLPPYDSKNHDIINANDLKTVLSKYKMPIALFSGHYHAAKITKRGNIVHISSPALAYYPNSFRIIEIENRKKQAIFKFDFVETGLKDIQAKTKILTLGGARYYGKPEDRNTTIILDK